jgi:uncharacterized membrane protein
MTDITIIVLGILGFFLCVHIYRKKRSPKPLVCPLKGDCDSVIKSDYSTLFGIGLEIYGLAYYGIVTLSYLTMYFYPELHVPMFYMPLLLVSTGAFLFSMYLTGVQAFKIKSWCTWCLTSAGISTLIAIASYIKINL